MDRIDVVVVSFNSRSTLRGCVEPLCRLPGVHVVVVDNASADGSSGVVADLPVEVVHAGRNRGFAAGCNLGIAAGEAPYVLLLNPDARLEPAGLRALAEVLRDAPGVAVAGPRIQHPDGSLAFSQRRFASLRSTWAQGLFLHRLLPRATWTDQLVRDAGAYERASAPDWLSGACMLVRRAALEALGGLDEAYFLYCEDQDLCRRIRDRGGQIRYVPEAVATHVGGASSSPGSTLAVLARSRITYARRHYRPWAVPVAVAGIAAGAATHALAAVRRPALRRGHAAALRVALVGGR